MFNTIRPLPAPECLTHKKYNTEEIVHTLEKMFYGKCFLCERDELFDPEIEHLEPHEGDNQKKQAWNNLFYACSRCNSIKSNTHKNLLDCCDANIDIFRTIKCVLPSIPDDPISVSAQLDVTNPKIINTVKLLEECYNKNNTALRGITRAVLMDKLFENYTDMLNYRRMLKDKKSTADEKLYAKQRIQAMLKVSFPFSVFWRWHLLDDSFLSKELVDLIDF